MGCLGQARCTTNGERGVALVVVVVVLAIILIGGLAAIAITSGELDSSRGFRSRNASLDCADAGIEEIRAALPNLTTANGVHRTLAIGSTPLTYGAGHYSGGASGVTTLSSSSFDGMSLLDGQNVTNRMGSSGGGFGGMQVINATSVCTGTGFPQREVEMILRYGNPAADR